MSPVQYEDHHAQQSQNRRLNLSTIRGALHTMSAFGTKQTFCD
jgi:hypothetical protein